MIGHWNMEGIKQFFKEVLYLKDILIVILVPIVLLPFLLVEGGGQVSVFYIMK